MKNTNNILFSIEADSRQELSRKCFQNNYANDREYDYHSVSFVDGKWVAWFRADASNYVNVEVEAKE